MGGHILTAQRSSSSLPKGVNIDPEHPREIQRNHLIVEPDEGAWSAGRQDLVKRAPDPVQCLMQVIDRGVLGEVGPQEFKNLIAVQPVAGCERKHFEETSRFSETPGRSVD